MDYDTFTKQFPSDAFLKKWAISEAEYKEKFIATFNARGFLGVGMTDVGLSKLFEAGAVVEKRGTMRIVPEKLDISDRYNREVRHSVHGVLRIISTFVHRMQDGLMPIAQIAILSDSSLVWSDEHMSVETVSESVGMPSDILVALQNDMRSILAEESFDWASIGTFSVTGDSIVCEPNPDKPQVARLSRLGRPPHPPLNI